MTSGENKDNNQVLVKDSEETKKNTYTTKITHYPEILWLTGC